MNLKTLQFAESLNKPYKYRWESFRDDRSVGFFSIDNAYIEVAITVFHNLSMEYIAEIVFSRNDEGGERFDVTGDGDAFRIFATVMKMIEEWVKKYGAGLNVITFTAEKESDPKGSRAKLYNRMAKKFAPKGWKYEKDSSSAHGRAVRFKLINLKPKPRESGYKI